MPSFNHQMELSTFTNNIIGVKFDNNKWEPLKNISVDVKGEHPHILRPKINEISHRLVVDIDIVDYVKVVTLRSGLLMQNETLVPVEISMTDSQGKQLGDSRVINPEEDFAVTIDQCYNYWFRIRPKGNCNSAIFSQICAVG